GVDRHHPRRDDEELYPRFRRDRGCRRPSSVVGHPFPNSGRARCAHRAPGRELAGEALLPGRSPPRRRLKQRGSGGPPSRRPATAPASSLCEHMFVSGEATILHADLDAFFASVEQRDDPRLRGRPVIVGGGVVLAASYEAKACGVRTAMGGRQALRLCPQAIVVPPRMSAYAQASRQVFGIFADITPLVEGISIDEAFLDVGGLARIAGTPLEIALRLRARVLAEAGL